jgi:hypothetical protein
MTEWLNGMEVMEEGELDKFGKTKKKVEFVCTI